MLTSVETTGKWEKKLREIENGTYRSESFINDIADQVRKIIDDVRSDIHQPMNAKKHYSVPEAGIVHLAVAPTLPAMSAMNYQSGHAPTEERPIDHFLQDMYFRDEEFLMPMSQLWY